MVRNKKFKITSAHLPFSQAETQPFIPNSCTPLPCTAQGKENKGLQIKYISEI